MVALGDTRNRARVNPLLTNLSIRRNVDPAGLVAQKLLTSVNVKQDSGLIGRYDKSNLRIEHDIVGGETPYPRISVSTKDAARYALVAHGLSGVVTEKMRANEEQPFDAEKDMTVDLTDKLLLGKEVALATPLTDTGTITQNVTLSGTSQFNDYTNSKPLEVFAEARETIYEGSGQIVEGPGGFAVVPWVVYNRLKYHPALLENLKYTENKKNGLSFDEVAACIGVTRILIPYAQYNTAKEGQTPVLVPVWGKHIVIGYAPLTGSKRIETLGFRVQKRDSVRVFKSPLGNPPNADEIMADNEYDFLLTELGAGYLIKDAVA